MKQLLLTVLLSLAALTTPLSAEPIPLDEYLQGMDRTEVSFEGFVEYEASYNNFYFFDEARDRFRVSIDAGRDAREQIEAECKAVSGLRFFEDSCAITGSGTIEIRGSDIFISIETINSLSPAK